MENLVIVRQYHSKYQSQVVDLILQIQQIEYGIAITLDDQPDLLQIDSFYKKGIGNFWIALDKDQVVGTVALLDIGNHKAALRKMFVKKEYRGSSYHVGGQLLNTAFEWAKEKSIQDIYLGTTPQFVAAHKFYKKHGFQDIEIDELPDSFPIVKVDKLFFRYQLS